MNNKYVAAAICYRTYKIDELRVAFLMVNTKAMFNGYRYAGRVAHSGNTITNQSWLSH